MKTTLNTERATSTLALRLRASPVKGPSMTADIIRIRETIARCRMLRDAGHVEAVLRSEFQGRLRLLFPDTAHETWINNYTEGQEARSEERRGGKEWVSQCKSWWFAEP